MARSALFFVQAIWLKWGEVTYMIWYKTIKLAWQRMLPYTEKMFFYPETLENFQAHPSFESCMEVGADHEPSWTFMNQQSLPNNLSEKQKSHEIFGIYPKLTTNTWSNTQTPKSTPPFSAPPALSKGLTSHGLRVGNWSDVSPVFQQTLD